MSEYQSSIRPQRSDKPCLPFPSPAKPIVQSLGLSSSTDQEEDGYSRETVKLSTPVCQHEISTDIFTRDATTPVVMPEPSPLPPPPDSPLIQLQPSGTIEHMEEEDKAMGLAAFRGRGGSQRLADRGRGSTKSKRNKGVVIGDFNGLYSDELSIKVGEEIEIISKDTVVSRNIGWWTGRKSKGKIGIFPAACVSCHIPTNVKGGSGNSDYPLEIKNSEVVIKEVIGVGGFGKVFRGIYKGEEVAVKVAKTTTFDSLKAVQDVISEAEKFAHLAHNNVCALVGVVLVKDVCLVMECAQGGSVSDVIHKQGISLSMDIIIDWASQIGSGMHYLHHEAEPSLIHRDLKTSNILLAHPINPLNLQGNVIKITDFGLAREIEHTTHMSGAGTYPWMAPEVIITSDFSKKSDVWSFGVVLWEMVTGERPYGGLNLYVVAFGVGNGTLSLPIPGGCPDPLVDLMKDCWKRNYVKRPSFTDIVKDIKNLESSEFYTTTSHEDFRTMQSTWRGEIQKKFVEQKRMEPEIQRREEILAKIISEQEEKKKELEREKTEIREKSKQLEILIHQYSKQKEEGEGEGEGEKEKGGGGGGDSRDRSSEETDGKVKQPLPKKQLSLPNTSRPYHHHQQQQYNSQLVRPPRVKLFSIRKLIRKVWGNEGKIDRPLPSKMESMNAIRRITSLPGGDRREGAERDRLSKMERKQIQGHKRRNSDEPGVKKLLTIDTTTSDFQSRRGSVPSSPNHNLTSFAAAHQPIIAQQPFTHQTLPHFGTRKKEQTRQRSSSDIRSPSPQPLLLPSYSSPMKKTNSSKQSLLPHSTSTTTTTFSSSSSFISPTSVPIIRKPNFLGLQTSKVKITSQDHNSGNSPSSPNVTITPAEHPLNQYDSGKDSLTCSDASGHSNSSETHPDMIKLDSPIYAPTARSRLPSGAEYVAAEFDPLRPSISHDSLLFESKNTAFHHISASPTPTPIVQHQHQQHHHHRSSTSDMVIQRTASIPFKQQISCSSSTSPKSNSSTSPRQSLTESGVFSNASNNSIVRPRPRPSKDFQTISAPSSRPPSPKLSYTDSPYDHCSVHRVGNSSPTGSVQSMKVFSLSYDSETYFDSDTTSNTSSLIDFGLEEGERDFSSTMLNIDFGDILSGFNSQQ